MTDVSTGRQLSPAKQALLAQRLRGRGAVATIRARAGGVAPPLSFAQERLWFMEQLFPGSAAHTIPVALQLRGALDAGVLELALGDVADRHEALRMCYPAGEDGSPEVRVREADGSQLPLRVLSAGAARAAGSIDAAQDLVGAAIAAPFDLATGPVARAALVRLADDDHVLVLAVHHIACDGWSADILLADLFALYEARRGGRPPGLAELPVQYGDYAIRQRERLSAAAADGDSPGDGDFAYWKRRLAALPTLDLVTDRPRPAEQTHGGAAHGFRLDRTLTRSVHDLARRRDATAYMVLLAGFQVLLGRYAAQEDFAVGSPVAGRLLPELEPLVGCFVNLLTMRADLSGRPSFADLLGRVREVATEAYDHQELPFERLVQRLDPPRDVSRPPLFQVLFAMQNYQREAPRAVPAQLAVEGFALQSWATRFDLELYVAEDDTGMDGLFVYNTDLFEPATVARLAAHFTALLTRLLADPDGFADDAEILGAAERAELITGFNDTAGAFPAEMTLRGARVVLAPDAAARDGAALNRIIECDGVTDVQATPSGWRLLLEAGFAAGAIDAVVGGEALPPPLAAQLRGRVRRLVNMYGPTETTIWSSCWQVPPRPRDVLIGGPIAGTRLHILDERFEPVPIGVPGELCIAGEGLARGYLGRPGLTAERFTPDPFGPPGSRLYRTGDRARRRPDGAIEFLGRSDNQVKLRGHRIELGEIEAVLGTYPKVRAAAVAVRDEMLVAYVVGEADDLLGHAAAALPSYMVPALVIPIDAMPLTPNGKTDRLALPVVRPTAGRAAQPRGGEPHTPAQRRVAQVFTEVLGCGPAGVDDDFFALGGHSLPAAKTVARLGGLPIGELFAHPTVGALATVLEQHVLEQHTGDQHTGDQAAAVAPGRPGGAAQLSPAQQRLWFLHQLEPESAAYNMYNVWRLRGPLDPGALRAAVGDLAARHEILRTRYPDDDGRPVVTVEPAGALVLEEIELRDTETETPPTCPSTRSIRPSAANS
jgi:hypothetical protein